VWIKEYPVLRSSYEVYYEDSRGLYNVPLWLDLAWFRLAVNVLKQAAHFFAERCTLGKHSDIPLILSVVV
jgi:hypothetical protein